MEPPTERDDLKFVFDERRAVQACAVLMAHRPDHRENYTKILKLLYLADREALLESGRTITGATYVCMTHGPVLSEVYDCITDIPSPDSIWDTHIVKEGFDIRIVKDPSDDDLSEYEVDVLSRLAEKYASATFGRMIDIVHELPEWHDPKPNKVRPLPAERILRASKAEIRDIDALINQRTYLNRVTDILGASHSNGD